MKKLLLALSLAALCVTLANAQTTKAPAKKPGTYVINGQVKDMPSGTAYLYYADGEKGKVDSTTVKNGLFTFRGSTPEPLLYTLKLSGSDQQTQFFVENTTLSIVAEKDSLYKAVVKGSLENEVLMHYNQNNWKPITEKAGGIYRRLDKATQKGKVKLDSLTQQAFDAEFDALEQKSDSSTFAFVKAHPSAIASATIIQDRYISFPHPEKAEALYAVLSGEVKNSFYGKQIKASLDLAAKTAVGKVAPDFTMADSTGKPLTLSSFKGKYVLVDFWASWCGPCRKENPNVVKAYQKYHSKGFEILGVSLDNKKEPWLKAIQKDGLDWHHVSDLQGWKNAAAAQYGVKSVPSSYLLDKDGKVIAKNLRGEELEKKLAEVLH